VVRVQPVPQVPIKPEQQATIPTAPVQQAVQPPLVRARITPMSARPVKAAAFEPPLAPKRAPFAPLAALETEALETEAPETVIEKNPAPAQPVAAAVPERVPETVPVVAAAPEAVPEGVAAVPEKILYPANCASCNTAIEVPFVPDGKRPTFCRDCLRDYQRSVAKARNEIVGKNTAAVSSVSDNASLHPKEEPVLSARPKTYASLDAPMSLAQMQYVGPKKFKSLSKRPAVNLAEVRALINDANKSGE